MLAIVTPGQAGAQQADEGASPVATLLEHEVSGSGVWRRANPKWSPGLDAPSHWVRLSRWGPGRDVVTSDVLSVFADGRCQPITHIVHHLDPAGGGVRVAIYGRAGLRLDGTLTPGDGGRRVLELSGTLPDGTPLRSRDVLDASRPDTLVAAAEVWREGAWVQQDTVRWVRQRVPPACLSRS